MEYLFTFVAVAIVAIGVLVFAKLLPIVPLAEIKEGLIADASGHLPRA
jgi:hypothetical protein